MAEAEPVPVDDLADLFENLRLRSAAAIRAGRVSMGVDPVELLSILAWLGSLEEREHERTERRVRG